MFKRVIYLILIAITLVNCHKKIAAIESSRNQEVIVRPINRSIAKDSFPYTWFGTWAGTLEIYNAKGMSQSTPMELVIGPTDTLGVYKWNIIYGVDKEKGLRPYLLRTVDASKGVYLNDELNSIKMEAYYLGGKLFCNFNVQGNQLTSIEEKVGDQLKFEIIFGKEKPVSVTGNEIVNGDTIPTVKTMPVLIYQKALLTKRK